MSGNLQQVHVRVTDAATGKPTPCRVRFTDAEGNYYPPHGRLPKFAAGPNQDVGGNVYIGVRPHAYIDGSCEIYLPVGVVHVEISKGPEYKPVDTEVQMLAGKLALRFTLERWTDWRAQGWYSGDTRVLFLSPHAALLESQAEDLAVVNLLAADTAIRDAFGEVVSSIPNLLAFSAQDFALSVPGHGVAVNTLNRHPDLGTLALLNCHRLVFPLSFGGPDGRENWTLSDWCDQCHRKAGLVVWADTAHQNPDCGTGEALANLVLGKIDAFEMDHFDGSPFDAFADWQTLLNAGVQTALVGASGKNSNGRALGVMRTYAQCDVGQPPTYKAWIEALRAGRTFATNGPLIRLTVNDVGPSRTPLVVGTADSVRVHAEVQSWLPFDHFVVFANGQQLVAVEPSPGGPPYRCDLDGVVPLNASGWIMAACFGATPIPDRPASQRVFACTSPLFVHREDRPSWIDAQSVRRLLGKLDIGLRWVEEYARCDDKDRQRLANVFIEARRVLEARLDTARS